LKGKEKLLQAKIKSKSLDVSQVFESLFAKRFNACISYQIPIEIILLLFFQNNEIKKKKDWFFGICYDFLNKLYLADCSKNSSKFGIFLPS